MPESPEIPLAFDAAARALQNPELAWIARSAVAERAYFLGLYQGLAALWPGNQLSAEAVRRLHLTSTVRDGDDAFTDSAFSEPLQLLQESIADPRAPELEVMQAALDALQANLVELQAERERAQAHVHGTLQSLVPLTDPVVFREMRAQEHADVMARVQALEPVLRALAKVELRWTTRLGVNY